MAADMTAVVNDNVEGSQLAGHRVKESRIALVTLQNMQPALRDAGLRNDIQSVDQATPKIMLPHPQ